MMLTFMVALDGEGMLGYAPFPHIMRLESRLSARQDDGVFRSLRAG